LRVEDHDGSRGAWLMANTDRATVLVTDDDRAVRESLKAILERSGYGTSEARNGEEALDILGERSVDVMLLDLAMPGLDGLGVLAEITPPPPVVIVLSAFAYFSLDDVSTRARGKVFRCLRKPVPPQQLLDTLSEALGTSPT
jgi:DNA-binding NtrC family response regulator